MNILNKKTGFTLTEMLVVVIIIAILTISVVPFYKDHIERQKIAAGITTLRTIADSLERYDTLHHVTTNLTLLDIELDESRIIGDNGEAYDDGDFTYTIDTFDPAVHQGDDDHNAYRVLAMRNNGEYTLILNGEDTALSCVSEGTDTCDRLGF